MVAVRSRVLAPREVLSRAVALGRRELLVEPGGLHPVLAQERVGGGDDNRCRENRDDEKTPAHDLSSSEGKATILFEVAFVTSSRRLGAPTRVPHFFAA